MSITIFGTCRLMGVNNINNIHITVTFPHSTKEMIQMIKFFRNEITIPPPYDILCFRTAINNKKGISFDPCYNRMLIESNVCLFEISSRKKYIHNNFYLDHLGFDKSWHKLNYKLI